LPGCELGDAELRRGGPWPQAQQRCSPAPVRLANCPLTPSPSHSPALARPRKPRNEAPGAECPYRSGPGARASRQKNKHISEARARWEAKTRSRRPHPHDPSAASAAAHRTISRFANPRERKMRRRSKMCDWMQASASMHGSLPSFTPHAHLRRGRRGGRIYAIMRTAGWCRCHLAAL
jgi:hypothetical protein